MDIPTIISLIEFAIEEEPSVATALQEIFTKSDPTAADWQALRAKYAAMNYDKTVTNSQIPPENPSKTS